MYFGKCDIMIFGDAVRVSDATHGRRCHYTYITDKNIKYSQGNGMVLYLERAFYFCVFSLWGGGGGKKFVVVTNKC